jgi:nitrate/TMAO reductase-like tetraheme cytochrome c subunit
MMLLYVLVISGILMLLPLLARPSVTLERAGKVFAFLALVIVPVAAAIAGLDEHVERSKTVAFCTSCHPMQAYGRSLHIDDISHLAAQHYQLNRVPRETACFACHTHYTMYGDLHAKLRGLRHVWVQYLGHIPQTIHLYSPYNNRECLHCHEGARSFVEAVTHKSAPGRMEAIRGNRVSCMSKDCHGPVHDVAHVDKLPLWPPEEKK